MQDKIQNQKVGVGIITLTKICHIRRWAHAQLIQINPKPIWMTVISSLVIKQSLPTLFIAKATVLNNLCLVSHVVHCTCAEETWFQDLMVSETTRCTKTMNPWRSLKLKLAREQCLIFHFCSSALGHTGCIFGHTVNFTGAQICQWAGIEFPCPCLTPVTHEILLLY